MARRQAACLITGLLLAAFPALGQEAELDDAPAPASVYEIESPLQRAYPPPEDLPPRFPWLRQQLATLPPFLADSRLGVRFRTYWLRQDRTTGRLREGWAAGGSVRYRSGWLADVFAVELEGFTSQPIVAQASRDGTLLLREPGQRSLNVLAVANGKLRLGGVVATGYRQKLDLPYLNRRDNRMVPVTFEAAKIAKEAGPVRFAAGYAWRFKPRAADEFEPLSRAFGVSESRGAAFGNLLWEPGETSHLGASVYVIPDVLATSYAAGHHDLSLSDEIGVRLEAQLTHQATVGDELGPSFETWNFGARSSASWRGAVFRLAFSVTGENNRIESPYGSNPSYITLMQRSFTQADEKALLTSFSYDFAGLGVEGLSAILNFAQSWDGVVAGVRSSARTLDLTADYRLGSGRLEGLWLRVRASWLHVDSDPHDGTDFRVILRYDLPVI
jgi:hypothetical protein